MADVQSQQGGIGVVLLDANVIYSRALRDYILYAAEDMLLSVAWSDEILSEMVRNLMRSFKGFTIESSEILIDLMNEYFPAAAVEPDKEHFDYLLGFQLPDEGDRHVLAAALAAEADAICTMNNKHFPAEVVSVLGIRVVSPDDLLCEIIDAYPQAMLGVQAAVLEDHHNENDEEAMTALSRAGAPHAADSLRELIRASS
jgi:predicted nucleic acid-binding protein